MVLLDPLHASLIIYGMDGLTQIHQEGWRLNILKRPHRPFTDEELATPLPLTALSASAASRSYIFGSDSSGVFGRG